jgi:MFS family permease
LKNRESMLATLRFRNFRYLWIGSLCSYAGQWVQQATIAWLAYDMTGSKSLLGAILGVRAIPMFLCVPLAGVAADRYDRRALLLLSQAICAITALLFGIVLASGHAQVWHLFLFVIVSGAGVVMDRPLRLTIIFNLVPRESAMQAVALNILAFSITRVGGPALAGFLIAWVGPAGNFFVQTAAYFIAIATVLFIVFPAGTRKEIKQSAFAEMMEALRFAWNDRDVRVLLAIGVLPFIFLVPVFAGLLPIFVKDIYHEGPEVLGILLASVGVGGVIGGWLAGLCMRFNRQGLVQAYAVFVMAAAFAVLAVAPIVAVACFALVVAGAGEMVHFTSSQATLQMCVPESMRGRMASFQQLCPGFISIGILVAGVAADFIGIKTLTALAASVSALFTVLLLTQRVGLARIRVPQAAA